MSLVPLRFRDWWEDFERPLSRLPDQHFGRGWFRDDLISRLADWSLREPRSPLLDTYYRPWRSLLGRDGGSSTIRADKDRFQVGGLRGSQDGGGDPSLWTGAPAELLGVSGGRRG
jgi:crystallin alpha B